MIVPFKIQAQKTFSIVRDFSFQEKKESIIDENRINQFLDAILNFKQIFITKTEKINSLNVQLEDLTWSDGVNEEALLLINDVISSLKDLHSTLIRQYVSITPIRDKGIAKIEIKNFKMAVDDLKESYQDLESVYFFLPKVSGYTEITKELSLI